MAQTHTSDQRTLSRWEKAASGLVYLQDLEKWYGVDRECLGGDACTCRDRPLPDWAPDGCVMDAIRSPAFQTILRLHNCKAVSPLTDWPDGYAAWVVDGLVALEDCMAEKRYRDMKEI